jgi:hypothetical protein
MRCLGRNQQARGSQCSGLARLSTGLIERFRDDDCDRPFLAQSGHSAETPINLPFNIDRLVGQ